jgi:predicted permease
LLQIRLAVRTLFAAPLVTTVAVGTLSLGIGANIAIFSLFHQVLFRQLPVPQAGNLVNLSAPGPKPGTSSCNQAGPCSAVFSYPMFRDLERGQRVFSHLAAHRLVRLTLADERHAVAGDGLLVSGGYFPALGIAPALGRLLAVSDDADVPGGASVVVLSARYWRSHFDASPAVLNSTLSVNGQRLTIVGVAPAGFSGTTLGGAPLVYVPMTLRHALQPTFRDFQNRRSYWAYVFGRLAPGVSIASARLEMNRLYQGILSEVEVSLQTGMSAPALARFRRKTVEVESGSRGQSVAVTEGAVPLSMLFAMTALVLLVACANLANLQLARASHLARDIAVRLAIGANRRRVVGQLLLESCLIGALGGIGGVIVALLTLSLLATLLPPDVTSVLSLTLEWRLLAFAGLLASTAGVTFGLVPALRSTKPDLISTLSGTGHTGATVAGARLRSGLVVSQMALSMLLLGMAGLFAKSLANIAGTNLGLDVENVLSFRVSPGRSAYSAERSRALFDQLEQELRHLPGVTSATGSMVPLLAGSDWGDAVQVEGFTPGRDENVSTRYNEIGPEYFQTLGIPVVAGRPFTAADRLGNARVAIVNEAFVRRFGLGADAVGKRMTRGAPGSALDTEIVGVVRDASYSQVKGSSPPAFFLPFRQDPSVGMMTFYMRTDGDPLAISTGIPAVVGALDPHLPIEDLKTLSDQVRENVYQDRFISLLSMAFALLATVLAATGLYGVLAYTVALRTREFGIRLALGAGATSVLMMVLRHVGRVSGLGAAIGLVLAWQLGGLAQSVLYQVRAAEPVVFGGAASFLALISVMAGLGPALRASRIDPMQSLRRD